MGEARVRMHQELIRRGYGLRTREHYMAVLWRLEGYFGKDAEQLGPEEVREFQLHLTQDLKLSASSCNVHACALKFLYREVLGVPWSVQTVRYQRRPKKLPDVLSQQELARLFEAAPSLKERVLLKLAYSGGLRLGELLNLAPTDIDSKNMLIHIREGKGRCDRYVMLSHVLLPQLRAYFVEAGKPKGYLFEGSRSGKPLSRTAAQAAIARARRGAGIEKHITMHTLRHCFATHLLEQGVDIRRIQLLLGHTCLSTTGMYLRLGGEQLHATASPLDRLAWPKAPLDRDAPLQPQDAQGGGPKEPAPAQPQ
jgi:integrase/recombinase XerD